LLTTVRTQGRPSYQHGIPSCDLESLRLMRSTILDYMCSYQQTTLMSTFARHC
jgi:hypothetical protein